jgi:hypothetical protein
MEVAQVLGHFPGVSEVAVYGVLVPGYDGSSNPSGKTLLTQAGRAGCAAVHLLPDQAPTPQFFTDFLKYAHEKLPKYAVPVFLRLLVEVSPMHNQKQNKIPLKKDGISLDAIYGPGKDAADAKEAGRDLVYWWPGALRLPNQQTDERYIVFRRSDWDGIVGKTVESRL